MKKINFIFGIIIFGFLSGCSGNSLLPNANEGNPIGTLEFLGVNEPAGEVLLGETKTFTNDLGYEISIEEAQLNWRQFKLISSGNDPECLEGLDQTIAINRVMDLFEEDKVPLSLGSATIPRISFCQYEIMLAPTVADSAAKFHAEGGEVGEAAEGIPLTFHIRGQWTQGVESREFELTSEDPILIQEAFLAEEGGEVIEHPFHFHGNETTTSRTWEHRYDLLLDGIDFATENIESQTLKVKENIGNLIQQEIEQE